MFALPQSFPELGSKLVKQVISFARDVSRVVLSESVWSLHSSPLGKLAASGLAQLCHGGLSFPTFVGARREAHFVSSSTPLCWLAPA